MSPIAAIVVILLVVVSLALTILTLLTLLVCKVVQQLAESLPEHAEDVPDAVLEKFTSFEAWASDRGYQWIGFYRYGAMYQALWKREQTMLIAAAGEFGEASAWFNSEFKGGRELLTVDSRLSAVQPLPPHFVTQVWLKASREELEQFHQEGISYLQGEAGWGPPREIGDSEAVRRSMCDSQREWAAFVLRPPLWPLRLAGVVPRAILLPPRRSARQRLPVEQARRL